MNINYQRNVFPILNKISHWYTLGYYEYKCCSSVAVSHLRSLGTKDILSKNKDASSSNDKERTLDSFTDSLVRKKLEERKLGSMQRKPAISTIVFNEEIQHVLHKCLAKNILPDEHSLKYFSQICAMNGDKASILMIKRLSKVLDSENYKVQARLDIFLAEALWRNEHFEDALTLLWSVYADNALLQRRVKKTFRKLIANTLSKKGEAVLVLVTNFSKKFVDRYSDYTCMYYMWEHCFLSEWHSDNMFAAALLEEVPELKKFVQLRVHQITYISLTTHKISIVQRLFEVLLKYEMKLEYELVLRSLFDYACSFNDLITCSKIIQSCHDLDVTLTERQKSRFLQYFYKDVSQTTKLSIKTWAVKPSKFTFKF